MNHWVDQLRAQADRQPWLALGVGVMAVVVVGAVLWRMLGAARRGVKGRTSSVLITAAALMATAVQSAGMWKFFAETMALPLGLRIFLFSFMEVALLACGTRAKENVHAGEDAGIDGVLVIVLALGSGVLAATDASSWQEVLVRLMVSTVAALLWERDLLATKYAARQDGSKPETIRWRFGWKTLAVRWGWADAGDSSLADQGANRVFDQFVRATHAVNRSAAGSKQHRRAADRQATAQARLMSYARLNTDLSQLMKTLGEVATAEGLTMLGVRTPGEKTGARLNQTPNQGQGMNVAQEPAHAAPIHREPAHAQPPHPEPVDRETGDRSEHVNGHPLPRSVVSSPVVPVPAPRPAEPPARPTVRAKVPEPVVDEAEDEPEDALDQSPDSVASSGWYSNGRPLPDPKSAQLARRVVGQFPEGRRVTQKAFIAEYRKHRPISNRDGAALHRYAVGATDPDENGGR